MKSYAENGHDVNGNLALTHAGTPRLTISNLCTILTTHPFWQGRLWQDVVRNTPMFEETPLSEGHVIEACCWLSEEMDMHLTTATLMERCLTETCRQHPRDLLKEQLEALPPWDGVTRLEGWLGIVASAPRDAYGRAVSRIIPLSMVARAMDPGCLYRYVVILEGPEGSGKTSLVRALAGEEWYTELTKGLDNKEVYMLIQGAWVAEMAELDTLTHSEGSRLKAFVTAKEDQFVPKYSNLKTKTLRRTILIGTTNDKSYLKGESGNTRFLPISTGAQINVEAFALLRDQLFAEALYVYTTDPVRWWQFPADAATQAVDERDARRVLNVYEQPLEAWLQNKDETTWEEIADGYLHLDPAAWEKKSLQMQIASALKALHWERQHNRQSQSHPGISWRYWRRLPVTTVTT